MAVKIDQKIKGYSVVSQEDRAREAKADAAARDAEAAATPGANVIQMHEKIERP